MPLFCWFHHFLDSRAEFVKFFVGILVQTMTPKGPFEINWPLGLPSPKFSTFRSAYTYDIRSIRHLSRSWQKNGCMYGSLTYSSLVLLTSFPWSFTVCIHTYFLIPFLFACDSLYNPKTQLFRSCYFVLVTKYQTLGGMDSSFEHPKPALFYILAHLPLIIGNVCLSG